MSNEGRTTKFLKNATGSAIFQIVNAICGMITPRIMLTAYGSQVNGLVSSITQFLSCLAVVEAGLALAAQQSLYKPLEQKDNVKISAIVSATRIAYNQVGYLFTALTILLAFLYPVFAGVETMSYTLVASLVIVLSMNHVLSFFIVSKYQVLFQADQKVYVISLAKSIARIINTICIVVMAAWRTHILLLRVVVTSSVIIQAVIIYFYAKKNYPDVNYKEIPDKSALNQRWDALYLQILGAVTVSAPAIILTFVASLEQVSIYSVYNMVFSALMGILGIFISGINASFGTLMQSKEKHKVKYVYAEFENVYYLLITTIYAVAMIMIVPFVKLYTHGVADTDYLLPGLGVLFTVNAYFYNLKTPQGMMVQAAGLFRRTRKQNTIQAVILLVAGVILGCFWGIYGVLLGSIASNVYRCIDLLLFIPKNVTKDSPTHSVKRVLTMIISGTMIYIVGNYIVSTLSIESYMQWLICASIIGVCVTLCLCLIDIVVEKKYFLSTCKRIIRMVRKNYEGKK